VSGEQVVLIPERAGREAYWLRPTGGRWCSTERGRFLGSTTRTNTIRSRVTVATTVMQFGENP